jgi:hypothetical protein
MPDIEIIYNDVMFAHMNGEVRIPAGTMVVLPSAWCDAPPEGVEIDEGDSRQFPDFLLVCEGQSLRREGYPGWSAPYPGGFYDFTLPNLRDAFIVGFDTDGNPVKGTGCVYYTDVPEDDTPPRHQQLLD